MDPGHADALTFMTLGPEGSNHAFVLRAYLQCHGLGRRARAAWTDDFHAGARAVVERRADYLLQCAAHPLAAAITGGYREALSVVDAFIAPSQPMALVRSRRPRGGVDAVGVQPATQDYVDLSPWPTRVLEPTVLAVHEGLKAGRYTAGIAFNSLVDADPEAFEIVAPIGAVCDAWIVYGRHAVDDGQAVVWTASPVAAQYHGGPV